MDILLNTKHSLLVLRPKIANNSSMSKAMANTVHTTPTAATLPNEILTQIFRNLLLMKENVTIKRPSLDKNQAIADIELMNNTSAEGATFHELKATQWFQEASRSQAGIWTERQAISNIDTRFMRVNKHWAAVGRGVLRREQKHNHFIEVTVTTGITDFTWDLGTFGLKAWLVGRNSKRSDPVIKISIKHNSRFARPATLLKPRSFLLRLEDVNDFGRFLMLQSNKASWKYQCIELQICRAEVPGFCNADTAVTRLYQIPFGSGLRRHLVQVCIPPGIEFPATMIEEQAKLKAYFYHNYDERDVYSAGGALEHMLDEYQQSLETGDVQVCEKFLREIIQLALTVLVTRFPKYGTLDGNRDMRHLNAECYLLQVLRFSAYELSEMHTFLAVEGSPSARDEHTLFALQCMAYALGLTHCEFPQRSAWRGLCYMGMFQICLIRGKEEAAWEMLHRFLGLILSEDSELSLQIDQLARRGEANAWCGLAKMWKADYMRSAKDGERKWHESQSFRANFAKSFLETQLASILMRCWPEFEGVVAPRVEDFDFPF